MFGETRSPNIMFSEFNDHSQMYIFVNVACNSQALTMFRTLILHIPTQMGQHVWNVSCKALGLTQIVLFVSKG